MESITNNELKQMIKEGNFFGFCCGVAINKGFKNVIKDRKDCVFSIGKYEVRFIPKPIHFELNHKIYIFRIIHAYYFESHFIGDNEDEVINDLITEFEYEFEQIGSESKQ